MGVRRWLVVGAFAVVTVVVSGAALAVGPWPGLASAVIAPSGQTRYTAVQKAGSTTLTAMRVAGGGVVRSSTFDGAYGIPAVTSTGLAGGLSPDGRLLVLAETPQYGGLRTRSSFLVVDTRTLSLSRRIVVDGEFGFDAISPDRRTLFLIQHTSSAELIRYVVRAYDLAANRLLSGAIVDKREPDETMRGYPVARATSKGGTWVYTLYRRSTPEVFVHALNAANRTAFCIDFSWKGADNELWSARLQLAHGGRLLRVRSAGTTVATIDTKTLRVR